MQISVWVHAGLLRLGGETAVYYPVRLAQCRSPPIFFGHKSSSEDKAFTGGEI